MCRSCIRYIIDFFIFAKVELPFKKINKGFFLYALRSEKNTALYIKVSKLIGMDECAIQFVGIL